MIDEQDELLTDEECWDVCNEMGITNALVWFQSQIEQGCDGVEVFRDWIEIFTGALTDFFDIEVVMKKVDEPNEEPTETKVLH